MIRHGMVWIMIVVLLVACSPDPKPVVSTRYFIEGVQKQDDDRIEKGLCLNVQRDQARMIVGPFVQDYLDGRDNLTNFNVRQVNYEVLTTETYEAVVEVRIPDYPTYYFLNTVEDRGWCVCGDLTAEEWQNRTVRADAIQQCRGR